MYYIVDARIDSELICSRLWKASQFYTPDSQTLLYNKKKKQKKTSINVLYVAWNRIFWDEAGLHFFCNMFIQFLNNVHKVKIR